MVAIGFLILHGECNLALQMASTEKLETRSVIKFRQQQGDTPSKTLKESAATHRKHAVSRTVYFDWHTCFREGTTSINEEKYTDVSDVSGECVGKRRAFNGEAVRDKIRRKLRAHANYFSECCKIR